MKALVGAFNQEKALVGAFSVIVKIGCGTDGSICGTNIQGSTLFPRSCETGRQNISNSPSLRSLSLVPRRKLEKDNNILGRK